MLACASNSSILKVLLKTGESGAKVHPWLHSESRPDKARLRPCLKKAKQKTKMDAVFKHLKFPVIISFIVMNQIAWNDAHKFINNYN